MTPQELGSSFETITRDFFVWLLEKIGFIVTKARVQKAGNQNGFDILIIICKDFTENKIFIECKNYETDLSIGNILKKGLNLESNYVLDQNDLFIAINPKSNFSNEDNSEKLSPTLSQKFKFSYYALDLSNGVRELFALNNNFYKLIYQDNVDFEIDEKKELHRFESIIYSRKPFKKIHLTNKDKVNFIGEINLDSTNIERHFYEDIRNIDSRFIKSRDKALSLKKIMEKEDKIFIIGNPGIGKSTELNKFASENWSNGDNENFVPILKSLKNFTSTDEIASYLPSGWQKLNKAFFILDGIDEISDIEYFKSKMENFIGQNAENNKKYKYIISCRSNVYESIVKSIPDFKVYHLRDLNYFESIEYLKNKCGSIIDNFYFHSSFTNFLKTPFQLEILTDFINSKGSLPQNTTSLWETYINNRLSHDKNQKLKKINLNILAIKKWSMKISLINELMKNNVIDEDSIYRALNEDNDEFEEFKKNPLLTKEIGQDKYFFEHRNIQEYFAAVFISRLTWKSIKELLIIEKGLKKTHQTLFNSITFLINIIDEDKYGKLVNWLIENEPELLFKADTNRTGRYKVKVFQHYFQSECIEKTFWISNSRTFTVKEIGEFGDCTENFDYLIKFVTNKDSHFRAVISALDLLGHFTVPQDRKEFLKATFWTALEGSLHSEMIKSHILECTHDLQLCVRDELYLDKIFYLFRVETSKQINRALLSLIQDYEDTDRFFWYLKEEFKRDKGLSKRVINDEVIRGNTWVIELLILKLNVEKNFIELARYYFDESGNDYIESAYVEKIISRSLYFEQKDPYFLARLFESFDEIENFFLREEHLKKLVLQSSIESRINLFDFLIENTEFNVYGYFLASITDHSTMGVVMDKFKKGTIDSSEADFYRNIMANNDRSLAAQFNNAMIQMGFLFREAFLDDQQFETKVKKRRRMPQENFNILFDKKLLLSEIKKIFIQYGPIIEPSMLRQINEDWYSKNGRGTRIELPFSFLGTIVRRQKSNLTYQEIVTIIDQDHILIVKEIKTQIQHLNDSNKIFTVDSRHKDFLLKWCLNASEEIDFNQIIEFTNCNSISLGRDYIKLKAILYFVLKFDFELPQDFLLESIKYIDINSTTAQDGKLQDLLLKIKDKNSINKRIIENLKNGELYILTVNSHIQYALNNKLAPSYKKIGEFLSDKCYSFDMDKILRQYLSLTGDVLLLKNTCLDIFSYKCWISIKILMDLKKEPEFCLQTAIQYLDSGIEDEKNYYYSSALSVLFELNSIEALNYVMKFLDLEKAPSVNKNSYLNYNAVIEYEILGRLYDKVYSPWLEQLWSSDLRNFLSVYISNLSKSKSSYLKTQGELLKIKLRLQSPLTDNELYYINQLIDESRKSYLLSKSKTFSFDEALAKTEAFKK